MGRLGDIKFGGTKKPYEVAGEDVDKKILIGKWGEEQGGVAGCLRVSGNPAGMTGTGSFINIIARLSRS